jgi:hypothetical protein
MAPTLYSKNEGILSYAEKGFWLRFATSSKRQVANDKVTALVQLTMRTLITSFQVSEPCSVLGLLLETSSWSHRPREG